MPTVRLNDKADVGPPVQVASEGFITTDLDLAAYLKTIGRNLIGTQRQGRFVAFQFEPSASADAQRYLTGATVPAQAVLANYRELRTLITKSERQNNYARTSNSYPF
jgi:hypothetical protein